MNGSFWPKGDIQASVFSANSKDIRNTYKLSLQKGRHLVLNKTMILHLFTLKEYWQLILSSGYGSTI